MFVKNLLVQGFRYLNLFWWVLLLEQDSGLVMKKEEFPRLGAEQGGEAWEQRGGLEDRVSPGWGARGLGCFQRETPHFLPAPWLAPPELLLGQGLQWAVQPCLAWGSHQPCWVVLAVWGACECFVLVPPRALPGGGVRLVFSMQS